LTIFSKFDKVIILLLLASLRQLYCQSLHWPYPFCYLSLIFPVFNFLSILASPYFSFLLNFFFPRAYFPITSALPIPSHQPFSDHQVGPNL